MRDNNTYIVYEKIRDNSPRIKQFISIFKDNYINAKGSETLKKIFNVERAVFDYSKPVELIHDLMIMANVGKEDIILDSFAGSGTTGHAVLDLNKNDDGNRKFILVELEKDVVKEITTERLKRAIKLFDYDGGFEYCELTKPLFDQEGQIDKECDFNQLANYIYFTETQTNVELKAIKGNKIGEYNGIYYYLLFKAKNKNILNHGFLESLKKDGTPKIVYADQCMVDDDILEQYNIIFKQIPYEVRVY